MIEAFPWDPPPKYLLRDRDGVYGYCFHRRVKNMGFEQVLIAPRSPWPSPFVERLVRSTRREYLDHVIVLNERISDGLLPATWPTTIGGAFINP